MPPLDLRLVPAALTAWLVTAAGMHWPIGTHVALACIVIAMVAAFVRLTCGPREDDEVDWVRARRVVSLVVLSAAIVGAGFSVAISLRSNQIRHHPLTQRFGTTASVSIIASESPRSIGSARLLIKGDLRAVDDVPSRGRVTVLASVVGFDEVRTGQELRFRAKITKPGRRDLTVATLKATGEPQLGDISPVARAAAAARQRFAERAREVLPAEQAAMLPALVLGDTAAVSPETARQFRTAGLTHLTAVSGANVTIVCGAVLLVASLVGPRIAVLLASICLLGFVVVVEPTASVLRAAVMGAITLLAILTARQHQTIPALAGTVVMLMVATPHLAVEAGFALSVAATAALVLLAPWFSSRLVSRGWPKPLADAVSIAAAAQLVTAPLVAGISGMLSLVAVLANLLVAVVIAPITVLGTAAAALCPLWPGGAGLLIRFTGPELWWLIRVAQWTARIPHAAVPVPSGMAGVLTMVVATVGMVVLWKHRWFRRTLAVLALVLLAWNLAGGM